MLTKILKNKYLIVATSLLIVILTLFWLNSPAVIVKDFYDAIDYIDYAYSYNNGPLRFFNDYRAPLYPLFLFLQGFTDPNLPTFGLYFTQSILLISNLVFSWLIILKLTSNKKLQGFIIIMLAVGMDFFWMVKTALSEMLTMFFLLLSVNLFLAFYKKPNILKTILIGCSLIALYLTRPFNMYLFLPICLFWFTYILATKKVNKKQILYPIILVLIIFGSIYSYSYANKIRHNYFGVSIEGGANLFARVAKNPEWLPESDPEFSETLQRAKTCAPDKIDYFTCQYPLVPHVNPLPQFKGSLGWQRDDSYVNTVEKFSKKYILKSLPLYFKDSIIPTISGLTELNERGGKDYLGEDYYAWYGVKEDGPYAKIFQFLTSHLQLLHYFFAIVNFIFAPLYLIYRYFILKKKNKHQNNLMLVYMLIGYYVLITGLVAAGNFGRMVTPALPLIYSLSIIVFVNIVGLFKSNYKK